MTTKIKPAWKIVEEHPIEDFKIFNLRKSTRINPRTGKPYTFFLMSGLDWVNLIALTPQHEVILVRQYRHGADCETLELPGGCVEPGEDPAESAKRELQEEAGYKISKIEALGSVYANPALQSIKLHCFVAFDAVPNGSSKLDEGEDITTTKIALKDLFEAIRNGTINHALIVAAAALFALKHPEYI